MCLANIMSNTCYNLVLPFIPLEFQKLQLDEIVYGYIFGVYAVASTLGSLGVGKLLTYTSRKFVLTSGLFSMGVCIFLFSKIGHIRNHYLLTMFWIVVRLMQGLSSSMIQTTTYSIVAVSFKDKKQKYLMILEASQGVGLIIGPILGTLLNQYACFESTFSRIGSSVMILVFVLIYYVPSSVDIKDKDILTSQKCDSKSQMALENKKPISYISLMLNKSFFMISFIAFISYFHAWYTEPLLAIRFMEFNISELTLGVLFSIKEAGYTISQLVLSFMMGQECKNNKLAIFWGLLFTGVWHSIVGPAEFLPNSLAVMILGNFMVTFGGGTFFILVLTELIKDATEKHPGQEIEASDISAGVFNSMLCLGQMVGPIYGSYATKYLGFRKWTFYVSLVTIIYTGIFYFTIVKQKKEPNNEKLK